MSTRAVIQAIDDGHYGKEITVKGSSLKPTPATRYVCRVCLDDMPCNVILSCRAMPQAPVPNTA